MPYAKKNQFQTLVQYYFKQGYQVSGHTMVSRQHLIPDDERTNEFFTTKCINQQSLDVVGYMNSTWPIREQLIHQHH